MKKSHFLWILGFILILIASIWLFTRHYFWAGLDLTHTGTIGDTIGGITSPIIGIVGSYFIVVSFRTQLKANKMQFDALAEDRLRFATDRWYQVRNGQVAHIKAAFQDMVLRYPQNDDITDMYSPNFTELKGYVATTIFITRLEIYSTLTATQKMSIKYYLFEFETLLREFELLIKLIHNFKDKYEYEGNVIKESIRPFYINYIRVHSIGISEIIQDDNERKLFFKSTIEFLDKILISEMKPI